MWPPATFKEKEKKNRTKRNLWLFDSPPIRTCCIHAETWNVSDNSVCIFHLVQCQVHGWDLKEGYGFLDSLHVDIPGNYIYIYQLTEWNIPKHITIFVELVTVMRINTFKCLLSNTRPRHLLGLVLLIFHRAIHGDLSSKLHLRPATLAVTCVLLNLLHANMSVWSLVIN